MPVIFEEEQDIIFCLNCDAEFTVNRISVEDDQEICFCPFCGNDIGEDDTDEEDDFEQ